MKKKYKTLTGNTLIFAMANISAKILSFLLVPIYTNIFSTTQFGTVELVVNSASIVIPIISLSISDAILRFGIDQKRNPNDVLKNSCLVLLVGMIIGLLLIPVYGLYEGIGKWNVYFAFICITQMVRASFSLYIKSIQKTALFAIDTVIFSLVLASTNIILLVFLKLGISGYFVALIFANFASIVFMVIFGGLVNRIKEGKVDRILIKEMLMYSIPLIVNALSWWFINFVDRVMLNSFMSTADVGIYSAASKIPNIITTVLSVFIQAWTLSSIMEYDGERDTKFYGNVFKMYLLAISFITFVFIAISKPFMSVYVGKAFFEAWKFVPLLVVSSSFSAISSFVSPFYSAAKKNIAVTITTMIAAVTNIIGNYFLIPSMGIIGAVIATTFAHFILFVVRFMHTRTFFKIDVQMFRFWSMIAILTVYACLVTMDFMFLISSAVVFVLLLAVNYSNIVFIIALVRKFFGRRKKGGIIG